MKYKVLISDPISQSGIDLLHESSIDVYEWYNCNYKNLLRLIGIMDGMIVRTETNVTREIIKTGANGRLKIIGRAGVGLDNIDLKAAEDCSIVVLNTPDANTVSAAEHTMGMMLALSRHIPQATGGTRQGRWERHRFMGVELNGKRVAIIGVGRVGSRVAALCHSFGMQVMGYDPLAAHRHQNIVYHDYLVDALYESDFVSIHVPLNNTTKNYIDAEVIHHMKRGVRIINCARGGLVNQDDLIVALDSGHVSGYACDVFSQEPVRDPNHPFYTRRQVICTPHIGAQTFEAQERVGIDICTKIRDFFQENYVT